KIIQTIVHVPDVKRIDVENSEMMKHAVHNSLGVGILPYLGIDKSYQDKLSVNVVPEIYAIPNKVYVHYRKNPALNKAIKKITYAMISHKYTASFGEFDSP